MPKEFSHLEVATYFYRLEGVSISRRNVIINAHVHMTFIWRNSSDSHLFSVCLRQDNLPSLRFVTPNLRGTYVFRRHERTKKWLEVSMERGGPSH